MIHESAPWRSYLARDADLIERWTAKSSQTERRSILIERKVFLAAYSVRKLGEAAKLSTGFLSAPLEVIQFPSRRSGYAAMTNHKLNDYFDLARGRRVDLECRQVLNLLIHSLVFVEMLGDSGTIDAFMVTSDRERFKGLTQVDMAAFVTLIRCAANDQPTEMRGTRDQATGEWRIWAGQSNPQEAA